LSRIFTLGLVTLVAPAAAEEVPKEARDRGMAATVRIESAADGTGGSGVMFAQSRGLDYVLTAAHVAPKGDRVEVRFAGSKAVKAEVIARSADKDLAVLRFAPPTSPTPTAPAPLAATGTAPDRVASVGWEEGVTPTARAEKLKGAVRLRRAASPGTVLSWEVAEPPAGGRSGGPLIDQAGRVVGLASGHDGTTGYYVHIDEIHMFLRVNALGWLIEDER